LDKKFDAMKSLKGGNNLMNNDELKVGKKYGKRYFGDCMEIMPTIPSKSVDMILCDLP